MKKHVLNDLKRHPLVDKTNVLQMPNTNDGKYLRKQNVQEELKVDKFVPYSKLSHLKSKKNAQLKVLLTRSKDISSENSTISKKRSRKKPSRCPCCTDESSLKSVNEKTKAQNTTNLISGRKLNKQFDANERLERKECHDPKFNLQCKVTIERVNLQEFLKETDPTWANNNQQKIDNKNVSKPTSKIQDKIISEGQFHRDKRLQEQSVNGQKKNSISIAAKSLRKQIKPNYAEITLNTSQEKTLPDIKQICATRVPVYRQNLDDEKTKRPDKLYEFDESDSDRSREQGKGKRFAKKSKLDNSLYSIPQKRDVRKAKARINQKTKGTKIKRPAKKYADIMQEVIQKLMEKVSYEPKNNNQGISQTVKSTERDIKASAIPKHKTKSDNATNDVYSLRKNIPKINLPQDSKTMSDKVTLTEVCEGTQTIDAANLPVQKISRVDISNVLLNISSDNISIVDSSTVDNVTKNEEKEDNIRHSRNGTRVTRDFDKDDAVRSQFTTTTGEHGGRGTIEDPAELNKENIPPQQNISPVYHSSEDIIDESFDDDGDNGNISEQEDSLEQSFLELLGNVHSTPVKSTPKINIISDIVLHENDSNEQPIMDDKTRPSFKHNPWRFDQIVRRNPHFIILKQTALPCLRQDMVLDHNQVEKIEEHFSKTPKKIETPKRSPVQKSILNYVNSPDRHNQENIPRSSLFDYDDFSPIKEKSPQRNKLKDKAKRNILAPTQDNAANIVPFTSTPTKKALSVRQPFMRHDEDEEIANCFGFNDDDVSDNGLPKDKGKLSEAKPFRIKEYASKKKPEQAPDVKMIEDNLPVQEPEESQVVSDDMDVQLFDDPEQGFSLTVPSKIYERKPRRKRLKSMDVKDDEHLPKRRKKDMMTKAEEVALENWAAGFNAMCEEIEKYDLEIE